MLLSELTDKFRPYPVSEFAHLQEQLRARGVESLAGQGSVMGAGSMLGTVDASSAGLAMNNFDVAQAEDIEQAAGGDTAGFAAFAEAAFGAASAAFAAALGATSIYPSSILALS